MKQQNNDVRQNIVNYHIVEALRGLTAEAKGSIRLAQRLNAETELRLILMSDDDLWELARRTSCPPERSVELAYNSYKERVEELKATASRWMKGLVDLTATDRRE